jgi:hypothetical protein
MEAVMSESRKAGLRVLYDNVDISAHLAPYVLSATFSDNAHGKVDDFSLVLEDRDGLWKGDWHPHKGATLSAWFDCLDWDGPGHAPTLFCGTFEVDRIDLNVSGAGDTVTLKGVSAKVQNSLRGEAKTRSWENVTLRRILRDLADEAGMGVIFDAGEILIDRIDQTGENDLGFLKRIAEKHGLNLKVAEDMLVMFDGAKYDARPAVSTLVRGSSAITSVRLGDGTHDVYKACTVSYHDPATKEDMAYTYAPNGAPASGSTLKINGRVKDLAEAMTRAQSELRKKNKGETMGSISMLGDPRQRGGVVVNLSGFGVFDGPYFVESASHAIDKDGGYTTENSVRRTVEY